MTNRQLAALLSLGLIWGASFLFIRVLADAGVAPLGISGGRTAFGLATLAPFAWFARRQFPRTTRTWMALAALGLVNFALPWTLFGFGEKHVSSGTASIINSGMPLWSAVFATILIRTERLTPVRAGGLLLGFAGVTVIMGTDLGGGSVRGMLAIVLATLSYGFSGVSIRRWLGHVPALPLTIGQIGFACLMLMPAAIATGAYSGASMGAAEWSSLVLLGAAGSGFAVAVYMWLIAQVGAVRAAVVTYLMPPIGVTLGWLLLDESIGWNLVVGLVLIILGVAVVQGVPIARLVARAMRRTVAAPAPAGD